MKKSIVIALCALAALMLLALPFLVPSGSMLSDYQEQWMDMLWEEDALLRLLIPTANAEEAPASLPIDFTPGMTPNPDAYTEEGYEDESITVALETREEEGVVWRIARIRIQDPSQLRTGIAGSKVTSDKTTLVSSMARKYHAVVAFSGDYYTDNPAKTSFEYRMGVRIRNQRNNIKDILIIDQNGDFHTFIKSDADKMNAFNASGLEIVNAFTFGPALVSEGNLVTCDMGYGYNPDGMEPRMAIGQLGPLEYVVVLAEGRNKKSEGVDHQTLANFMFDLGCLEAYNLDGGNTATFVWNGGYYQTSRTDTNARPQSDCIYFATTVDPATWSK